MVDRIATMMIVRSLRDIADELKAIRRDLQQLKESLPRGENIFPPELLDESEMEDALEQLAPRAGRGQ
jgi:hypothetical protein